MKTRKVQVTITRTYIKKATIEVDVDNNIIEENLQGFLTNNKEIDNQLETALAEDTLDAIDTDYEYQDTTNNYGGHL